MHVIKRSGKKEAIHFDKITNRISKLMYDGLEKNIDPAVITQKICAGVYSGITTTELDNLASQLCMNMITDHPDYGVLGGRIAVSNHHKNTSDNFLTVVKQLYNNVDIHEEGAPLVSSELLEIAEKYEEEINDIIKYDRDYLIDYFGFKTLERSYLLKINVDGGKSKKIVERSSHLFMRVAIGIHGSDLENIRKTYDCLSLKQYTHATPTLFNSGSKYPQLSSCFLSGTDDSIEGIFDTMTDCAKISKWAGGIGIHISNIRSKGSYIRKTGGLSTGIMPMLKCYNDISRFINQGGKRAGSFAIYLEMHHADIFDFLEARKNVGDENMRAKDLFYALWISDIFMKCVEDNADWYLMDPDQSRFLTNVYGKDYTDLYEKYVSEKKYVKKIKARDLWEHVIASQIETGMPYLAYKNAVNSKTNQKNIGVIKSSNLCCEIVQYSDHEEIAVCNLASICLPSVITVPDETNIRSWLKLLSFEDQQLFEYLSTGEILLYSKENCVFCKLLKKLLKNLNLTYTDITFEEAECIRVKLNLDPFKTVPQVFCRKDDDIKYLGGYAEVFKLLSPRIDYKKLMSLAYDLTLNLNKVIDKNFYPVEKAKLSNMKHRPIGLGVQGLADVFMILKIPFTSDEASDINKKIFETISYGSLSASAQLAVKDGSYSMFKGSPLSFGQFQFDLWGLKSTDLWYDWEELREKIMRTGTRNSLNIALMPTASTASIFGNIESFEMITSNLYTRNVLSGTFTIINKHLFKDLIDMELWNEDMKDKLIYFKGSIQNIASIPKFFKEIYRTAYEVDQKLIIKMSADRGPFICQSQSLNLFFDKPTFKELTSCHFYGWKQGLKTGSYYIRTKPATSAQNFGLSAEKEKRFIKEEEMCLSCGA